MIFLSGVVIGVLATYFVMRHCFDQGWIVSDWFDSQLRQVEDRLSKLEARCRH